MIMGGFTLARYDNVLLLRMFGKWNHENVEALSGELRALVTEKPLSRWALVSDLREWELATPEALAASLDFQRWCAANGEACEVVIGTDNLQQYQVDQSMEILRNLGVKVAYFDGTEGVAEWLSQHQFEWRWPEE